MIRCAQQLTEETLSDFARGHLLVPDRPDRHVEL